MVRLEDILEKVSAYNPDADLELIKKAYVFSAKVHTGQTRLSGEEYLSHPLEVAEILTTLRMDPASVATGLLHDTVEDTYTTIDKIKEVFGPEIASMVDGLTKISLMTFERKEDREAENFRKMILAMAHDIRVVLIKLADRLHNMRTLAAVDPDKRLVTARETLDIYAPLANRLGVGWMKTELEDLSFMYLEPERFRRLEEQVVEKRGEKKKYIAKVKEIIESALSENGLKGEVSGRVKHRYSIYKKMQEHDIDFDDIHDILAFRVVVEDVRNCYAVLGVIHSTWKPVPGRFKDYIAIPKPNLYRSLHTTVVGPGGERMEVQIRTDEMHRVSEYGIAAHWKYKEGGVIDDKSEKSFAWLGQLLELQKDLKDSGEFMESLKVDLFPGEVFVFTPQGDVNEFPVGATPIDFAYAIHTDIGHRCAGAKVNGKMVPLKYRLRNGDVVEIITSNSHHPSTDWLKFVVSSRARARIRQWIRAEEKEKSSALGREICEKEFKKHDLSYAKMLKAGDIDRVATEELGFGGSDELQINVGYGKVPVSRVLAKILPPEKLASAQTEKVSRFRAVFDRFKPGRRPKPEPGGVVIKGVEDVMVRFAKCCNPLPGDEITGFITLGQGVAVHAAGCPNLHEVDPERKLDVQWDTESRVVRVVRIEVVCRNEMGLLAEMGSAIKDAEANIAAADIRASEEERSVCTFDVEVRDRAHLKAVFKALLKIKKVLKVREVGREGSSGITRKIATF